MTFHSDPPPRWYRSRRSARTPPRWLAPSKGRALRQAGAPKASPLAAQSRPFPDPCPPEAPLVDEANLWRLEASLYVSTEFIDSPRPGQPRGYHNLRRPLVRALPSCTAGYTRSRSRFACAAVSV